MTRDVVIDVRTTPRWQRHAKIFAAFGALLSDQQLVLISDHEPQPLHLQFEERHGARYAWTQRRLGDGRWEVRVRKVPAAFTGDAASHVLARSGILSSLSSGEIAALAAGARRVSIKRHHAVVAQGVMWPYVGIVAHGIVQALLLTAQGREDAIYDAIAGDVFGETALLDRGNSPLRHIALAAQTQVVLVPLGDVKALLAQKPELMQAFAELSAQRFRTALERFSLLRAQSSTVRVAQVLLRYAAPEAGLSPALAPLPQMTQIELALSAGTVKEVVSRALAELESAGAVQRERGHIVRLNRDDLATFVAAS